MARRNSKLDSFLKRNTDRAVYERIRAYEPCVVISETVNKVYMHVVLSDECVYLTEYPPRALTAAVNFGDIRDIELVNDLPDFLSGKDRERSQHIRVVYATKKPAGKRDDWLRREKRAGPPVMAPPLRGRPSLSGSRTLEGVSALLSAPTEDRWRLSSEPPRDTEGEEVRMLRTMRSASCPNPETLDLLRLNLRRPTLLPPSPDLSFHSSVSPLLSPTPPLSPDDRSSRTPEDGQVTRRRGEEGEREAELHLYAVSQTSRIYLHLQSSWNSFIIRSTLLMDPLYRRRCSVSSSPSPQERPPVISWERTAHLFRQLSGEVLQEGVSLENRYLLLQELRTAAHRNITLRKLFWRSSDMCQFLVQTLEDSSQSCQSAELSPKGVHTADQLLLCTLIAQTLAIMFRETEVEPTRLNMLTAKKGSLTVKMLMAVVCDPELQTDYQQGSALHSELQVLLTEYLDAACSLLFELLVVGQEASRSSTVENFLTVGWILQVLQTHPHMFSFVGHQAQQVVLVLSDPQVLVLSPAQCVLLYQRCRFLLASLQYSSHLGQYLRTHYREEFRYYVKLSCVEERLPSRYPISKPAQRLVNQLLGHVLQS